MSYTVCFSGGALRDLDRLQQFLARHDVKAARRALAALRKEVRVLKRFPFVCRKNAAANDPRLRELIVPFANGGYVVLFEIEDARTITILAVRHQREDDYI